MYTFISQFFASLSSVFYLCFSNTPLSVSCSKATHSPPPSTSPSSAIPSTVLAFLLWPSGIASPAWFIVLPGCSQHSGPHSTTRGMSKLPLLGHHCTLCRDGKDVRCLPRWLEGHKQYLISHMRFYVCFVINLSFQLRSFVFTSR